MSFAGMVAQLLGEPVALATWAGPVLVHLADQPTQAAPQHKIERTHKRKPRKAARAPQQVEVIPAPA